MEKVDMHNQFLRLKLKFSELIQNEEGQDLIEYGLIVTLIALAAIGGVQHFASAVALLFSNIGSSIT
ncbi:MAG TPA: Flp family type IVb pilin [Terracidiphilus sp.]|jgi:Flp pilus assembly pilin Flp|nr:Flp family type IVb pilin [Terracidiphilus sp.]